MPDPKREALRRTARYLLAAVRRAAPTAKAAESWHLEDSPNGVALATEDMGEVMSETGKRHPVYARGDRADWTWVAQNKRHPGRTHAAERAIDRAADVASERFADTWTRVFSETSEYWTDEG